MRSIISAFLTIAVSGCGMSVHPLFEKADLSREIDLAGTWHYQDTLAPGEIVAKPKLNIPGGIFKAVGDSSRYEVTPIPNRNDRTRKRAPRKPEIEVRIGTLKGRYFAEFRRLVEEEGNPWDNGLVTYSWAKISVDKGELRVWLVDEAALGKIIYESNVPQLAYWSARGKNVLTLPTKELQELLTRHDEELFRGSPFVFRRDSKVEEQKK